MLTPNSGTVVFGEQFSVTIAITTESSDPEAPAEPPTTIPTVTASFKDPGVTVTPSIGQVVISGKYTAIIPVGWTYLDKAGNQKTSDLTPALGSFSKIVKVDSPTSLTATCTYTIDGEVFTHTVDLVSFTKISTALKDLLGSLD